MLVVNQTTNEQQKKSLIRQVEAQSKPLMFKLTIVHKKGKDNRQKWLILTTNTSHFFQTCQAMMPNDY